MASRKKGRPEHRDDHQGPGEVLRRAARRGRGSRASRREEKRRILDSWALDAQLLAVAEEENMGGKDRPGLRDVKLALLELEKGA